MIYNIKHIVKAFIFFLTFLALPVNASPLFEENSNDFDAQISTQDEGNFVKSRFDSRDMWQADTSFEVSSLSYIQGQDPLGLFRPDSGKKGGVLCQIEPTFQSVQN